MSSHRGWSLKSDSITNTAFIQLPSTSDENSPLTPLTFHRSILPSERDRLQPITTSSSSFFELGQFKLRAILTSANFDFEFWDDKGPEESVGAQKGGAQKGGAQKVEPRAFLKMSGFTPY